MRQSHKHAAFSSLMNKPLLDTTSAAYVSGECRGLTCLVLLFYNGIHSGRCHSSNVFVQLCIHVYDAVYCSLVSGCGRGLL